MKFLFILTIGLLILNVALSQQKTNAFNNKDKAQQNNNTGSGKQTINNYTYYTISNSYKANLSAKENAINATRGFFKKRKDTTHSIPYLRLGSTSFSGNARAMVTDGNPIDPINVYKVKAQINIQAVIRDSKGDEFARITGNTWEISNSSNIEYNNDANALEIRSGKRVIFQIEIIGTTVVCNGMLCSEQGDCLYCGPNGMVNTFRNKENSQRFVMPPDFILKPLFKYPRFQYLGVRDK